MRVFKNAWFRRFAQREHIADPVLLDAIARANSGLVDADLGSGLIKQRISRDGQGKSGGYRSLIVFRKDALAFFVFGFAKNCVDNLRIDELRAFRKMSSHLLALSDMQIAALLEKAQLEEIDEVHR